MARRLAAELAGRDLPPSLADELRTVRAGFNATRIVDRLLEEADPGVPGSGLLRYLGWTAAARFLRPVVHAFGRWRDEERWLRNYCPTCGSGPAMAHLAGIDPERLRLLFCGHCATRWRYRRTSCPFCEADTHRLAVVAFEGERRLRIDYCEACKGYLKAYVGEGQEATFLADWTSLHLDIIALDRGLKRLAASLYDLPAAATP
jgi:FdhE protein